MTELSGQIMSATMDEYKRASEKYGAFNNSSHESYAVILEEYEETEEAAAHFLHSLQDYWEEVKENNTVAQNGFLQVMKNSAIHAAMEWVQVAAMCHKAIATQSHGH